MKKIPGKILRSMGFKDECEGLINRYIRVEGAWDDHLNRTREFILQAVAGRKFGNLAVLGSGWLLDFPLEQLAEVSGQVYLYDAVHPAQVIHKLRKYRNVSAISADITGGCIQNAWSAVKLFRKNRVRTSPEEICNCVFRPYPVPDYIISLNLLSQIGVMITTYLEKHIPYNEAETDRINYLLQNMHLAMLRPGRSCLVTDIREINTDMSDGIRETLELMHVSLPESKDRQTWEWQFDPDGHYKPGKSTVLMVTALAF